MTFISNKNNLNKHLLYLFNTKINLIDCTDGNKLLLYQKPLKPRAV